MTDFAGNAPDRMILPAAISRALKDRSVFLTGGSSPLGTEIAGLLTRAGARVAALVREPSRAAGLAGRARLVQGDCERLDEHRDEVRASAWVVHAAGLHLAPPLIRVLAGHPQLDRVGFISSARVAYPDPSLDAGELEGKRGLLAREDEITSSLLPWTIMRPTLIYSPQDRSLSRVKRFLETRPVFPLPGSGRAVKQPISAKDLAVSVVKAMGSPAASQKCYDLPGPNITVRQMFETMSREMGRKVLFVPVPRLPLEVLKAVSRLAGFARGHRALTRYLRWYREILVSGDAAREDFGHQPGSFQANIQEQLGSGVSSATLPPEPESG